MMDQLPEPLWIVGGLAGVMLTIFAGCCALMAFCYGVIRRANREGEELRRELYGLFRRLEGITAQKRELVLRHYDQILATLARDLPPRIAAHTGDAIFETERRVLARLAELEPIVQPDPEKKERLDGLIQSMERLESSVVTLTTDTVQRILLDSRRQIQDDPLFQESRTGGV